MELGTKRLRLAGKDARFLVRQEHPLNMEPPTPLLRQSFLTPQEMFFVRNHGSIPEIDPGKYRLTVNGLVGKPRSLSLEALQRNFPRRVVTAAVQCAGNRREELTALKPIPGEVPWNAAAIGNAQWAGAPLRDVLKSADMNEQASHVALTSFDEVSQNGSQISFGCSIPLERALADDVLLAYEMNGQALAPAHGFPLRIVVPGYIGARWVKWVASVKIQAEPSSNYFQTRAYKLFPPDAEAHYPDWASGVTLYETPVNSVICAPTAAEPVPAGSVAIKGYAIGAGGCRVTKVEVSVDGGSMWKQADLFQKDDAGAWCFWEAEVELAPGTHEVAARAFDSQGNTQPGDARRLWNFKGYANNSWHRVKLQVTSGPASLGTR